jgi:hypothetical protein
MRTELHGRTLWNQTMCLVPTVTVVIYFGEFIFANALAIVLLATSTLKPSVAAVLFCCGAMAFSLAEYLAHRFVLHSIAPVRHQLHHACPKDAIDKIFWQIWLGFVVFYLMTGADALAGALVAYAWYLLAHYCSHHHPAILPASLLKHHLDHHRSQQSCGTWFSEQRVDEAKRVISMNVSVAHFASTKPPISPR